MFTGKDKVNACDHITYTNEDAYVVAGKDLMRCHVCGHETTYISDSMKRIAFELRKAGRFINK